MVSDIFNGRVDLQKFRTPAYVTFLDKLEENLKALKRVEDESNARVLLALKAFSMYETFALISRYLKGTVSSGINEAMLAREYFGGEIHVYAPAFKAEEVRALATFCDSIVFNSEAQIDKFANLARKTARESGREIHIGLRVNPEYSEVETQISSISGIWSVIGLLASCLLLSMAVKICGLLIQVIAFGRMFELYVLLAVSPLPCAFFPLGDGSGGGMSRITQKFFKNFIAVCLQGVMIIVSIRIFYMIVGTALTALITAATAGSDPTTVVTDLCYTMLLAGIVLVMAVAKCGTWAKSIMDAM